MRQGEPSAPGRGPVGGPSSVGLTPRRSLHFRPRRRGRRTNGRSLRPKEGSRGGRETAVRPSVRAVAPVVGLSGAPISARLPPVLCHRPSLRFAGVFVPSSWGHESPRRVALPPDVRTRDQEEVGFRRRFKLQIVDRPVVPSPTSASFLRASGGPSSPRLSPDRVGRGRRRRPLGRVRTRTSGDRRRSEERGRVIRRRRGPSLVRRVEVGSGDISGHR